MTEQVEQPKTALAPIDGDEHLRSIKQTRLNKMLEETGLAAKKNDVHCHATSKWLFIKHVGFNNIEVRSYHSSRPVARGRV